ncbi:GerAB/ArcD/ProY family transporter [Clostridium formicaceticum]|uniref:Spore germination protein YndE n=1 Tax=Clostridium formicaceticum TaxID=1497 RepID=A0AAC9RPW1_9CLOT|nr:endospore germination permease [Clostridium formicaceticum]AOY75178.1 hypothetical protein BJL90_04220 [Clostridium formicaceticum]ARE89604.1 Spore germination protein YndE [Clostridium formicaceticum]
MFLNNDRISIHQMTNILILILIGIGILTLPRDLVEMVGTDGWLILLIGGIITMGIAFLHGYIVKSFPGKSYFEIIALTLTTPVAYVLTTFFIVYLIGSIGFLLRIFVEVVKMMLLPRTPLEAIILAILIPIAYLVRKGIEPMARLTNILFPTSVVFVIILFSLTLGEADPSNLRPVFQHTPRELLGALDIVLFSFLGYEMLLIFGEFLKEPQRATRIGPIAVFAVLIFYLLLNLATLSNFGENQIQRLIWPTLSVFKTIQLPGAFVENVEVIVMAVWVFTIFMTLAPFHLGVTMLISDMAITKEHNYFALPVLPFVYAVTMYSPSISDVYRDLDVFTDYTAYITILGMPIAILIGMFLRKLLKKNDKENM